MPDPRHILLATTNPHKLDEVRAILAPLGFTVAGLHDVTLPSGARASTLPEPREDGDTFEANSRIKAIYYAQRTGRACLADDSGLEVDALGGAPGVHSAYFAHGIDSAFRGEGAPKPSRTERDAANNAKLLALLESVPDAQRTARFVCVMTAARPDPSDPSGATVFATARGVFEGRIARAPRGDNGFGYDPLLQLPDGRTSAELPPHEKNARSHRAAAARAIAPLLAQFRD